MDGSPSLRAAFLSYLKQSVAQKDLLPVLAEIALSELSKEPDERRVNLNEFEGLIAESVDSVVIFPESPGSFSELGLFSAVPSLAEKTLVVSRSQHQKGSFITLGPIHHLSAVSTYKPLVIGEDHRESFAQIVERLIGNPGLGTKRLKRYEHNNMKSLEPRTQLAVIAEMVAVCGVLTERDFKDLLSFVFENYDISRVRRQLALLVAMGMIKRSDASDIVSIPDAEPLIEFSPAARVSLKGKWANAYHSVNERMLQVAHGVLDGQ